MFKKIICTATLGLALASPAAAYTEYQCPNSENYAISAAVYDEEGIAIVTSRHLSDGSSSEWRLQQAVSASGVAYQGQGTSLVSQGSGPAIITFSNGYTTTCRLAAFQDPGGPIQQPNPGLAEVPGFSFGGNLRDGPGMNFRDVGSLRERDPVILVSDSGVYMNGYSWWVIRVNGRQAYQWGGLLCAPGYTVNGIYNEGC